MKLQYVLILLIAYIISESKCDQKNETAKLKFLEEQLKNFTQLHKSSDFPNVDKSPLLLYGADNTVIANISISQILPNSAIEIKVKGDQKEEACSLNSMAGSTKVLNYHAVRLDNDKIIITLQSIFESYTDDKRKEAWELFTVDPNTCKNHSTLVPLSEEMIGIKHMKLVPKNNGFGVVMAEYDNLGITISTFTYDDNLDNTVPQRTYLNISSLTKADLVLDENNQEYYFIKNINEQNSELYPLFPTYDFESGYKFEHVRFIRYATKSIDIDDNRVTFCAGDHISYNYIDCKTYSKATKKIIASVGIDLKGTEKYKLVKNIGEEGTLVIWIGNTPVNTEKIEKKPDEVEEKPYNYVYAKVFEGGNEPSLIQIFKTKKNIDYVTYNQAGTNNCLNIFTLDKGTSIRLYHCFDLPE